MSEKATSAIDGILGKIEHAFDGVVAKVEALGTEAENAALDMEHGIVDPLAAKLKSVRDWLNQKTNGGPPLEPGK